MRYQKFLALLPLLLLCGAPTFSAAGVDVSFTVNVAPPMLPVYEQPPLPEPGYLWTPGYWAWDGMDYFWVPGTWVQPPVSDMLWTPGYWGWRDGFYGWNPGYWGTQIGYYGGVNYGYGYTGVGYQGGYWHGGAFFYNRSVANFGQVNIVNVYNAPINHHEMSRVSFNGGQGGLRTQPNDAERAVMNGHHSEATAMQRQHEQRAAAMPAMHLHENGGRPQILTTQRAADFAHPGPGLHNHQQAGPGGHGAGVQLHGGPQSHEQSHDQLNHEAGPRAQPQHQQEPRVQAQHEQGPRVQPQHQQGPRPQAQHEQGGHEQGGHGQGGHEPEKRDR
jgi:hypothetical protein